LPELPEVEITRRHLATALDGHTLTGVQVRHDRTARYNASPAEVESRLSLRRIENLGRHGKFLVADLDDGQVMVAHLGMSGRFTISNPGDEILLHTHFVAAFDDDQQVRFIDPRTFGFVAVFDDREESPLSRLGPDAWSDPPSAGELSARLRGRTAPIKALLLDQGPIAGLGNIYADEILHRSRIHPLTPGGRVRGEKAAVLLEATRDVLAMAIANGGTTLDDLAYLLPDGRAGENLSSLSVYGREDLPCPSCGTPIRRVLVRARSTHFCPSCQKSPRGVVTVSL